LLGVTGALNGGCPLFFWGAGGCSQTCQTRVSIGALGIEACLYAGTPGKCTVHTHQHTDAKTGLTTTVPDCTCD
jgi:hypothetical protein